MLGAFITTRWSAPLRRIGTFGLAVGASHARKAKLAAVGQLDWHAAALQSFTEQHLNLGIDAAHVGRRASLHRLQ